MTFKNIGAPVATEQFVHLHSHTEYSLLDGAAKIRDLLEEAFRLGQPAVASTDHGNVFSHYEMWKTAAEMRKLGKLIIAILGVELYVAPGSRFDKKPIFWGSRGNDGKKGDSETKDVSGAGAFTHMTMIAANARGLNALFELTSRASIEGSYAKVGSPKPRVDKDLAAEVMAKYPGATLIGTTGCPSGAIQTRIRLGQFEEAVKEAGAWQDILGKDNYFLELMDHGMELERGVRSELLRLADHVDIPLLATNDNHYVKKTDAGMHDALLAIQMGKKLDDPDRMKFSGDGYYLKSAEEMRTLFAGLEQACDNTIAIAERIAPDAYDEVFAPRDDLLPEFPVPDGHTADTYLREQVMIGLKERYPDPEHETGVRADAVERATYELTTIERMGYPSYMLMVADFIAWARAQGIRVGPGRGSAAGSIVSYALGITTVDTLLHGLLFERFINPERISPPDVDVDFEKGRRGEVFRYIAEKWGEDKVCRIQTVNRMKAKEAIKDAARVLGAEHSLADKMTKAFPDDISGFGASLDAVENEKDKRYADAADFRALLAAEPMARKVFELAKDIEGIIRKIGIHACGFIVSSKPLMGRIPLFLDPKKGEIVSGFPNSDTLEPMGYLKVDCLGLDTMDVIERAVRAIAAKHGIDVNPLLDALDDHAAFAELASGFTVGMFQVASGGLARLLQQMRADRFSDISAALALYRPGPMGVDAHKDYALRKTGRQRVSFIHDELTDALKPILGDTYGVIVYQEQIMRAAQAVAGYTLGAADLLRKAMGKKKPEVLAKEFVNFQKGMHTAGYGDQAIQALWDVFEPFSAYAFNIAHTVSYGHITYATAYLKAHYPAEFMASLLTQADDPKKRAPYLAECRRMKLKILQPDINASGAQFTPTGPREVRYGLESISGVGPEAVAAILEGRQGGDYRDFADFLGRVGIKGLKAPTIKALIRAGAFDSLGHTRAGLEFIHADAVKNQAKVRKNEGFGQFDLFSAPDTDVELLDVIIPDMDEWDREDLLAYERKALSQYVSAHPLDGLEAVLAGNRTIGIADLYGADVREGKATVAGRIMSVERLVSRKGNAYAKITLADLDGECEAMIFSRSFAEYEHMLVPNSNVCLKVTVALEEGSEEDEAKTPTLFVDEITALDMTKLGGPRLQLINGQKPVVIRLDARQGSQKPYVDALLDVLRRHRGTQPVVVQLISDGQVTRQLKLSEEYWISPGKAFTSEMKGLLGPAALAAA